MSRSAQRILRPTVREQGPSPEDPVLQMVGVGKELWQSEPGDEFIERLRKEGLAPAPTDPRQANALQEAEESAWRRLKAHEGEEFQTASGLPFTYGIEGDGIWFFREGRRINRKLTRKQLNQAIARCPLRSTTEINDLMDYPYLFGVLGDRRIRDQAW